MDSILKRSHDLKQELIDFVLDAEGELAEALEVYAAQASHQKQQDIAQRDLIIDTFILEGKVGDKIPLDLFLESHPELSASDRALVDSWRSSFMGLFAVTKTLADGFELMNWLTAKQYIIKANNSKTLDEIAKFKEGEILLTRIAPLTDIYWILFGAYKFMGNLGKPKLAVAIGNFKDNYKRYLYSDAPELLEQAWQSVEQYHQDFVDFFGSDEVTMSGYEFNKKFVELQERTLQKRMTDAGIDDTKSFEEIAQETGLSEEEMKKAAEAVGADSKTVSQFFDSTGKMKMAMPKIDLPDHLKKAEKLTCLTHPKWGQMFLPTYNQFKEILESEDWQIIKGSEKVIRQYLEDPTINTFIWHRLAQKYPNQLESVLRTVLTRPEFKIEQDLDALLQEFNKPIEPELPEIASVPIHLHNLFQEALTEVHKSKPKGKGKKQANKGFKH